MNEKRILELETDNRLLRDELSWVKCVSAEKTDDISRYRKEWSKAILASVFLACFGAVGWVLAGVEFSVLRVVK